MTAEAVDRALDRIRPYLLRDGGDIELVGVADNRARVRLVGSCAGCPSAHITLYYGVEAFLKEEVPGLEGITVIGLDMERSPRARAAGA